MRVDPDLCSWSGAASCLKPDANYRKLTNQIVRNEDFLAKWHRFLRDDCDFEFLFVVRLLM